jgi:hypothetical protein
VGAVAAGRQRRRLSGGLVERMGRRLHPLISRTRRSTRSSIRMRHHCLPATSREPSTGSVAVVEDHRRNRALKGASIEQDATFAFAVETPAG